MTCSPAFAPPRPSQPGLWVCPAEGRLAVLALCVLGLGATPASPALGADAGAAVQLPAGILNPALHFSPGVGSENKTEREGGAEQELTERCEARDPGRRGEEWRWEEEKDPAAGGGGREAGTTRLGWPFE